MITVFTPTYNRGYIIHKLYESLRRQTFRDFEWLVIDDGSTDDTEEIIKGFIENDNDFLIRYYKVENGGKHRAINRAVKIANGELFFIVDSDDSLPKDSLEIIHSVESTIDPQEKSSFAGICGQKYYHNGKIVGKTFTGDYIDATTLERYKLGIDGDKAEVYYTEVLRNYPFPEFEGENFCTESIVWDRMSDDGLKLRFFNINIYDCDYLEDGLTKQGNMLYAKNPKQWALAINQDFRFRKTNKYTHSLDMYKFYLMEKCRFSVKEMIKLLQVPPLEFRLSICFQTFLDIIRKALGSKSIRQTYSSYNKK